MFSFNRSSEKPYAANPKEAENVIGVDSVFEGVMQTEAAFRIDGAYSGTSLKAAELIIGETARVKANVYADRITVAGVLIGDLVAKERVMLLPSAKLIGNISTPELITTQGFLFEGVCRVASDLKVDIGKVVKDANRQR